MLKRLLLAALIPWPIFMSLPAGGEEQDKPLEAVDPAARQEAERWAAAYLAGAGKNEDPSRNPFESGQFSQKHLDILARTDLPKAVAVFAEAETRFTNNLSHGGKLYDVIQFKWPLVWRDDALFEQVRYPDSIFLDDPVVDLRFLQLLEATPSGRRFSFGSMQMNSHHGVLSNCDVSIQRGSRRTGKKELEADGSVQKDLRYSTTLPEDVRMDALMAAALAHIHVGEDAETPKAAVDTRRFNDRYREQLGVHFRFLEMSQGLNYWKVDGEEMRQVTRNAIATLLSDAGIRMTLKQQLMFSALYRAPALLDDPEIGPLLADAYESYCLDEHSAITGSCCALFDALAKANLGPAGTTMLRRFHEAFWQNVDRPIAAGHLEIPDVMASSLIIVAGKAGDARKADRLQTKSKDLVGGNVHTIMMLMASGQYDAAKELLPKKNVPYGPLDTDVDRFTRSMEDKLPGFLAKIGDPLEQMRFQLQLLNKDGVGGEAPSVPFPERSARFAGEYRKNPAKDREIQLEMLRMLTRSNQLNAILLHDEITAWAKECDLKTDLRLGYEKTEEIIGSMKRNIHVVHESDLMQAAALSGLLQGDTALLEKLVDALVASPPVDDNPDGQTTLLWQCQQPFIQRTAVWLWIGMARDETTGFAKALDAYESLAMSMDGRNEFHSYDLESHLSVCKFLADWTGQPQRYDALVARMTRDAAAKKTHNRNSLAALAFVAKDYGTWKSGYFPDIRKKALAHEFTRMAHASWLTVDMDACRGFTASIPREELAETGALPMDTVVPGARAALLYLRAGQLRKQDDEGAEKEYRRSIDSCQGAAFDELRGMVKFALAELLGAANRLDDARTVVQSLTDSELTAFTRPNHNQLLAKLGLKLPPPASKNAAPPRQ